MKKILILALAFAFLFPMGWIALAGTDDFSVAWWTVDGGGATSTGGAYALSGTIGQHSAGRPAGGDGYQLAGGFWPGSIRLPSPEFETFLPVIMNGS